MSLIIFWSEPHREAQLIRAVTAEATLWILNALALALTVSQRY